MTTRREYYAERKWDGRCVRCGQDYFANRGNTTCLSCNAQRQGEIRDGLIFDEDLAAGETLTQCQTQLGMLGKWWSMLQKLHGGDQRRKDATGMTVDELAAAIPAGVRSVKRWLKGEAVPNLAARAAIERLYNEHRRPK